MSRQPRDGRGSTTRLPCASMARSATMPRREPAATAADDAADLSSRLGLWLADVSAEAALATTAADAQSGPPR